MRKSDENLGEPKLIRDILIFLSFANFYSRFIPAFSRIATLLISILRTTGFENIKKLEKRRNSDEGEINTHVYSNDNRIFRRVIETRKNTSSGKEFFIPKARILFTQLRHAFIYTCILYDFPLEQYIYIEIDASSYAISKILNQLTSDQRFYNLAHNTEFLKLDLV